MYTSEGLLPIGYIDTQGSQQRAVRLASLCGHEEEWLAHAQGQPLAARVTMLLSRCLQQIGDIAPVPTRLIDQLSRLDRQYLLVKVRQATFGDQVRASLTCPWSACGKRVALTFALSDLLPENPLPGEAELDTTIETACHECGRPFLAPFDIAAFFFAELNTSADRLYQEVHRLAYHYHWSEGAIMSMPLRKRSIFLDLLSDELEQHQVDSAIWPQGSYSRGNLTQRPTELWVESEDPEALTKSINSPGRTMAALSAQIETERAPSKAEAIFTGANEQAAHPTATPVRVTDPATVRQIVGEPPAPAPMLPTTDIAIPNATPTRLAQPAPLAAVFDWVAAGEDEDLFPASQAPTPQVSRANLPFVLTHSDGLEHDIPASVLQAATEEPHRQPVPLAVQSSATQPALRHTLAGDRPSPSSAALATAEHAMSPADNRPAMRLPVATTVAVEPHTLLPSAPSADNSSVITEGIQSTAVLQPLKRQLGSLNEQHGALNRQRVPRSSAPVEETTVSVASPTPPLSVEPPVVQQTIVLRDSPAASVSTPAFWERSYLRQSHLRLLR